MNLIPALPVVCILVSAASAAGLEAGGMPQTPADSNTVGSTADVAARADSLLAADEAIAALDLLDAALAGKGAGDGAVVGSDPDLSWRAARVAVNLGMVVEAEDSDAARERYETAEAYADARIAADSADAQAWEWLAIARGRRTLTVGLRTRATLVNGVRSAAARALALDSLRPGAHHVLGMWHAEIRRLNTFERLGAGAFGADDFGEATWDDAVLHLETATRLAPAGLVHGLELAKVYLDVDRPDDAAAELQRVTALDTRDPGDALIRTEAAALLARLEGGWVPAEVSDREASSRPR